MSCGAVVAVAVGALSDDVRAAVMILALGCIRFGAVAVNGEVFACAARAGNGSRASGRGVSPVSALVAGE